jgi:hypothetical protein
MPTFKVYLDGHDQLDYLTGKSPASARTEFSYFDDDGAIATATGRRCSRSRRSRVASLFGMSR